MNESIFDKVKEVARIEEVVEHFGVSLDRHGKALCPFHQEKTASFSIKNDENIFKCFGCGAGGDAIDFVAKYKDIEPLEAAKLIAAMYGIGGTQGGAKQRVAQVTSKANKTHKTASVAAKQGIKEYIKNCIADIHKTDYFVKRGLTKETIQKFCLGYDTKKQCVVIPYSSEHKYYQTRSIDSKEFRKPPTEIAGAEPLWNVKALSATGAVFIVESPICAMSVMQCGGVAIATCGTSGINKVVSEIKAKKSKCTFILSLDNDEPGQKAQQELANHLFELNIKYIACNIAGEYKDPNELLLLDAQMLSNNLKKASLALRKKYATEKDSFNAQELEAETIEPTEWIVKEMLPVGLSMLCAASKMGKSWMVLQLCLAVASNTSFLEFDTGKFGCLYYALEDSKARLKDRMKKELGSKKAPKSLHFAIRADNLDNGFLTKVEEELRTFPNIKLVVVDTLQKIRGKASKSESMYSNDYNELGLLKKFADDKKICILLVHHTRKMKDESDVFNMISGSNALMGAADTIFVIYKKNRNDEMAALFMTGRDIQQDSIEVSFDKESYQWVMNGTVEEMEERRAKQEYENNIFIQTIKELVESNPINGWKGSATDLLKAVNDITGKEVFETDIAVGKLISKYKTKLYYDGIDHKDGKVGSRRYHHFFKKTQYQWMRQGTILDY